MSHLAKHKRKFVRERERGMELKLPVGFRFRPTDAELMVHYLRRKARSLPLPASIIPELDVFHSDPWSLPGDLSEKRYYFWKKKKRSSNRKIYYETSSGYWKCTNSSRRKGKQIVASISGQINNDNNHGSLVVEGTRKMWTFHSYRGRQTAARTSKTRWVLHEFRLREENCWEERQDDEFYWVACCVFRRKMVPKRHNNRRIKSSDPLSDVDNPSIVDFRVRNCMDNRLGSTTTAAPPLPADSPPCSSDITTEEEV